MRTLLAGVAALPLVAMAAEPKLPDIRLIYAVEWNGMSLGDAVYTLREHGEPDCYRYESVTDPVGLVKMFYGKPRETSEFCVRDGKVVPQRFSYVNPKWDNTNFTLEFDVAKGKVTGGPLGERELPPNAQDRFALQQAVRLWVVRNKDKEEPGTVDFPMVDDDRIKVYRFAITGREKIETPLGKLDTLLVERIDDPDKSVKFWLARETDYLPVRAEQVRKDTRTLMELQARE